MGAWASKVILAVQMIAAPALAAELITNNEIVRLDDMPRLSSPVGIITSTLVDTSAGRDDAATSDTGKLRILLDSLGQRNIH